MDVKVESSLGRKEEEKNMWGKIFNIKREDL